MNEESRIRQMSDAWLAATNQPGEAGAAGYVSFLSEDTVLMPPNSPRLEGRQAVRDWTLALTSSEGFSIKWEPDRIEVASGEDLAYVTGSFEYSLKDADGKLVQERGKFLNVQKKDGDGDWKAVAGCFNSDLE